MIAISSTALRRLNKEYPLVLTKYPEAKLDTNANTLVLSLDLNKIHVKLIFDSEYPFRAPKSVLLNNVSYNKYSQFSINKNTCQCCESLLCGNKWSPGFKCLQIIDEIKQNINLKQKKVYLHLIEQIKDKYLVADIPIEEWI